MQLNILSDRENCIPDPSHRQVAEMHSVERLDEKRCREAELGERTQHEGQTLLDPFRRTANKRFADWATIDRIVESSADAEFGVNRQADFCPRCGTRYFELSVHRCANFH